MATKEEVREVVALIENDDELKEIIRGIIAPHTRSKTCIDYEHRDRIKALVRAGVSFHRPNYNLWNDIMQLVDATLFNYRYVLENHRFGQQYYAKSVCNIVVDEEKYRAMLGELCELVEKYFDLDQVPQFVKAHHEHVEAERKKIKVDLSSLMV